MQVEARHLRRGDRVILDGQRVIAQTVLVRKQVRKVYVKWVGYEAEQFDTGFVFDVEARDTLGTAFGSRRSRYGS